MSHGFGRHVVCGITLPLAIRCLVRARVGGARLLLRDAPLALLASGLYFAAIHAHGTAKNKIEDRFARKIAPGLPLGAQNLFNLVRILFVDWIDCRLRLV